jgi:hypothetical protein
MLIDVFLKGNMKDASYALAHDNAKTYLRVIAIQ